MGLEAGSRRAVAFAVLGHPGSDRYVEAPVTRAGMTRLREAANAAGEQFYCSELMGGCGGRLDVVNGVKRRPHFRHRADSRACQRLDDAQLRDTYTHRVIQRGLGSWLDGLGYRATLEKRLAPGSRVDVHCDPNAVIEVQLSAEWEGLTLDRTARYGGNVTWLFHPTRSITSRDAALERDGVVFVVRLRTRDHPRQIDARVDEPPGIEIGVCCPGFADDVGHTVWCDLEDCTFSPDAGIGMPRLLDAKRWIEVHRAPRAVEEQRSAVQVFNQAEDLPAEVANEAPRDRWTSRNDRWASRDSSSVPLPRSPLVRPSPVRRSKPLPAQTLPGPRPAVWDEDDLEVWEAGFDVQANPDGPWLSVLRWHADYYPEWSAQIDGCWANGLPEYLVDPAWAALFKTSFNLSGPVHLLIDQSADPQGLILARMTALGLLAAYNVPGGPPMCRSNHDLRNVGIRPGWSQPPAWRDPMF